MIRRAKSPDGRFVTYYTYSGDARERLEQRVDDLERLKRELTEEVNRLRAESWLRDNERDDLLRMARSEIGAAATADTEKLCRHVARRYLLQQSQLYARNYGTTWRAPTRQQVSSLIDARRDVDILLWLYRQRNRYLRLAASTREEDADFGRAMAEVCSRLRRHVLMGTADTD